MLNEKETVVFRKGDKEHNGIVLGCEREFFWLLVSDLQSVYVGSPSKVVEFKNKKYFEIFDHCQATDKMFNKHGEVESYLFDFSHNPESMIRLLKMYRLLGAA